jgi:high-affinity iron transporter
MMRTLMVCAVLVTAPVLADDSTVGKQIYDTRCSFCHGAQGKGDGPAGTALQPPPTNFTQPAYWNGATDERIRTIIVSGKPGTAMVPFGATLTAQEIDAVIAYTKAFKPK